MSSWDRPYIPENSCRQKESFSVRFALKIIQFLKTRFVHIDENLLMA